MLSSSAAHHIPQQKINKSAVGLLFFLQEIDLYFFFLDLHCRAVNIQKKPPTLHREHSAFLIEFLPS
jgi:hypothetical protein